ncbi:hypothetical protein [Aquisalimonas asiatica]|uniref:Uncharacterized protein n=1 Tax=Aquisalimonas asiatica TaxID=406100 RepID=A0A1H8ULW8_9GAMM|nr:hypothetical protein [Aquisalimonas asiatica]SEP04076.1 hypothetical protein SAMN04488052_10776 [Aquisalimonas asiatica]
MQTTTPHDAPATPAPGGHHALVLRTRLDPLLRRVLHGLGARVEPFEWRGIIGPAVDRVGGPTMHDAPDYLDADGAEALIELLQRMESRGGAPRWVHQMLSSHRAGALLERDGTLELGDAGTASWLLGELLRLPGRQRMA